MDTPLLSHDSQPSEPAGQMKLGTAWAAASGLMAAWVAAGSTGIWAQPLQIVFTGLALGVFVFDIVLVMGVFWFDWLMAIRRPRFPVGCCALAAIVIGHGLYLLVLAHAPELSGFLPESPEPILSDPYVPPPFSWPATVRSMLPWNLPFLAAAIQLPIVVMMLRWAHWKPSATAPVGWDIARAGTNRWLAGAKRVAPLLLALFLPIFAILQLARTDLNQSRILVHQDGPFDGRIPTHGRYGQASAGQFGMLPFLIQSLGGACDFRSDLSSTDSGSVSEPKEN